MLFHICTDEEWQEARVAGVYVAEAMQRDGFVHCSDPGTVHLPANRLYNARTDLVLLQVDPARLSVSVTWEPGIDEDPSGPWFPHIYGEINLDAVVAVHPFVPNAAAASPRSSLTCLPQSDRWLPSTRRPTSALARSEPSPSPQR